MCKYTNTDNKIMTTGMLVNSQAFLGILELNGDIDAFYKMYANTEAFKIPQATYTLESDSQGNLYIGYFYLFSNLKIIKFSLLTRTIIKEVQLG